MWVHHLVAHNPIVLINWAWMPSPSHGHPPSLDSIPPTSLLGYRQCGPVKLCSRHQHFQRWQSPRAWPASFISASHYCARLGYMPALIAQQLGYLKVFPNRATALPAYGNPLKSQPEVWKNEWLCCWIYWTWPNLRCCKEFRLPPIRIPSFKSLQPQGGRFSLPDSVQHPHYPKWSNIPRRPNEAISGWQLWSCWICAACPRSNCRLSLRGCPPALVLVPLPPSSLLFEAPSCLMPSAT